MELLTRRAPLELLDTNTDTHTVTVRLCRWNDVRRVMDAGRLDRETFAPGALTLAERVYVTDSHGGGLVGRALPDTFHDDGIGPCVDLLLADTTAGRDLTSLLRAGVIDAVSVEYAPTSETRDAAGVAHRTGIVHGVAFTFHPAHDAPVMAVREQPPQEKITMTTELTIMPDTPALSPATRSLQNLSGMVATESITPEQLTRALDTLRDELDREYTAAVTAHTDTGHPLAQWRSLAEYADDVYAGDADHRLLLRALADQITTDNPGVVPPAWVSNIFGIIEQARPAVSSFGTDTLPAMGMDVDWPYFDGDLLTLVGKQATQKTPITSVKVSIKKGTAPLETYAGGSDISYQLIRRSSPAYRDAYLRIMFNAYAAVTDNAAADAAATAAVASAAKWVPATGNAQQLLEALFTASVEVQAATGRPAAFTLAATDMFIKIGGAVTGVVPANYGTSNVPGTADAASLQVNVSGLQVLHDPHLAAGSLLVSNTEAGSWYEDGPFSIAAEDVEKLGQNVAVWGMGAFGAHIANGIRKIAAA